MALERYGLGATFLHSTLFQILNDLSLISKIRKTEDDADTRVF